MGTIVLTAAIALASPAIAGPTEGGVAASFQAFCLAHLDQPEVTIAALDAANVQELHTASAEPFLTGLKGRLWALPGRVRSIVLLTERGACSVRSPDVDGQAAVLAFEASTRHRLISTRERPAQTENRYAVTVLRLPANGMRSCSSTSRLRTAREG
jgi:hypothetical protein